MKRALFLMNAAGFFAGFASACMWAYTAGAAFGFAGNGGAGCSALACLSIVCGALCAVSMERHV